MTLAESLATQFDFKLTTLRKDVLNTFSKSKKPLKAYDVLERVRKARPNAQPPTVYRVLDFLITKGVLHKIDKHSAYTLCQLEHAHDATQPNIDILLICKICMNVTEISDRILTALVHKIEEDRSVNIDSNQIELQCICHSCQKIEN